MTKKLSPFAVGLAIKDARSRARMSAADLALEVGMTPSSLSRTENGFRAVELAEAEQIAQATRTTIAALLAVARGLEEQGHVQQQMKAKANLDRSLAEVNVAAERVLKGMRKARGR